MIREVYLWTALGAVKLDTLWLVFVYYIRIQIATQRAQMG